MVWWDFVTDVFYIDDGGETGQGWVWVDVEDGI